MSAAGRGGARIEHDNYPTPAWATRRILEALKPKLPPLLNVIEPCAGEGAIAIVAGAMLPDAIVFCSDIRPKCCDFMRDATKPIAAYLHEGEAHALRGRPFDLLITNPPFNLAHEIIQAQRETALVQAYLLRASFLEGERAEHYRGDMPDEYRLPERPNFIESVRCKHRKGGKLVDGCGWSAKVPIGTPRRWACPDCGSKTLQRSTSDASAYSWFVWHAGVRKQAGSVVILPRTPLEERRAA